MNCGLIRMTQRLRSGLDLLRCVLLLKKVYIKETFENLCKLVAFCNDHGYLYIHRDGEIDAVGIAYMVKDDNDVCSVPLSESGDILFVSGFVSVSKDKRVPLRLLREVIKNKKVKRVIYDRRVSYGFKQ